MGGTVPESCFEPKVSFLGRLSPHMAIAPVLARRTCALPASDRLLVLYGFQREMSLK